MQTAVEHLTDSANKAVTKLTDLANAVVDLRATVNNLTEALNNVSVDPIVEQVASQLDAAVAAVEAQLATPVEA